MMRARVLLLVSLPALVTCLQCYTCDGKKGLCSSGADPGDKTTCPSVFSLIRPSVMLALGMLDAGVVKYVELIFHYKMKSSLQPLVTEQTRS